MINVTFYKDSSHDYRGFKLSGHAGFDDSGKDIICAAVSVLVINFINSIEELTGDEFDCKQNEKKGLMDFNFSGDISNESKLLMESLVLGIKEIFYENEQYIQIFFKEV
ncbi:MAG: ribosomal-processing cysteine protease Prp [Lachnospiraceae bacterium]|nr:ribosomal-processing cysteine protease Prp [Lachnospiraceae bacterium]MBQ4068948.1 ribosomal-processing cysteine protease Prp [Lachnospiraceae bacterium]